MVNSFKINFVLGAGKKNTLFLEMTKKLLPLHFFIRGMDGKGEWIAMGYKELIYILKYIKVYLKAPIYAHKHVQTHGTNSNFKIRRIS